MLLWVNALQETTEEVLKRADHRVSRPELMMSSNSIDSMASMEIVPNAMKEILAVPGNKACADCSSTTGQHASLILLRTEEDMFVSIPIGH